VRRGASLADVTAALFETFGRGDARDLRTLAARTSTPNARIRSLFAAIFFSRARSYESTIARE
jgi:hypothetical protein